jgi:ABC-type branched-subunit amino acid transport system substrate-binding protein
MRTGSWKTRIAAAGIAVLTGAGTGVVISPGSTAGAAGSSVKVGKTVPASAMSTKTGVTAKTVTIGNIAWTSVFGGAKIGTEAYADYVNSKGGVDGRKLVVTSQTTNYSGTTDAQLTQSAIKKDFALVGGFSIVATSAGEVLAKNPGMPAVEVTIVPTTNKLSNFVSPAPTEGGWQEGSLLYFKSQDPKGVKKVGVMVADETSAIDSWDGQEAAMRHLGYTITYENTFSESASYNTFVADVVAMKNKGVKMLFIEQNPPLYAAPLVKALKAQDFHPMVVLGASTYSSTLIPTSGGVTATNGMYLEQDAALYLGTDAKAIPAVTTFLKWVKIATAKATPTLFTLYGWLSTQLFTQALKNAGKDPTRGSLLKALGRITTFSGTYLETPVNPAAKTVSNCYLIGRIENGKWVRQADPPVSSKTHGYRCTNQYYVPPGTPY